MKLIYPILLATFALGACSAQTITAFAGTGDYGFSGDGGSARFAQFSASGSIANDGAGLALGTLHHASSEPSVV